MRILHIIGSVGADSYGVGPVPLNLAKEQISLGIESCLWTLSVQPDIEWAARSSGLPMNRIVSYSHTRPSAFGLSLEMERAALTCGNESPSIVHQHGLWTGLSRVTRIFQNRFHLPTILAPHGGLGKLALRRSRWKKQIALTLYERANLHAASCLHAVGQNEIAHFRDFGLCNPIAVIPNGIPSAWLDGTGDAAAFRSRFDIPDDKRVLLFLSRITPIKGLPMLLRALRELGHVSADWLLVIAGSDEFGHQKEIESLIEQLGLKRNVIIVGMLLGQIKRDAFAAAELFVLPSYSEGAPLVILEALGAEVPVLSTNASPWQELELHDCGWYTEISTDSIAGALEDAFSRSTADLKRMGQRGRDLVAANHSWTKSAKMTIELYEWLLGRRSRPDFVFVD